MHYKNGRPAFSGDPVIGKGYNGPFAGTIHTLNPGATSCNAQVAVPVPGGFRTECVTIGDLHHAEDAFKAANAPYEPKDEPTPAIEETHASEQEPVKVAD